MRQRHRRLAQYGPSDRYATAAGHPITMDDWDAASARTPHLVKLQPSGPRPLIDLYAVGGVPVVMHELNELGLLDESAITRMARFPNISP